LVLEVKGDFCHRVRSILERHGRGEDFIEINLTDSPFRYNPLANDLDHYALAFGIATLLTSLFGRGREPFWQQAYTNMSKFLILLHRLLYDYVTLLDVYECATRLSAGGVADHFVSQMLRQGDAGVFKRYSQAKLNMMRESLDRLDQKANEHGRTSGMPEPS
jgi:hypothetical protein